MMPDPEGEVNWTSARKLSAPSFTETAALSSFIWTFLTSFMQAFLCRRFAYVSCLPHLSPAWCYLLHPTFLWSLKYNFVILQKLSKCWPYVELGVGGLYRMFRHNLSQLKTNTNHMHFFPPSLIMFTFVIYIFSSPHLPLFTFIMSVYHCRFSDVKLNSPVSGTDDNSDSQSRLYPVSLCFSPSLYCSLNLSPWKNKNTAMGDISVGVKSYHS